MMITAFINYHLIFSALYFMIPRFFFFSKSISIKKGLVGAAVLHHRPKKLSLSSQKIPPILFLRISDWFAVYTTGFY